MYNQVFFGRKNPDSESLQSEGRSHPRLLLSLFQWNKEYFFFNWGLTAWAFTTSNRRNVLKDFPAVTIGSASLRPNCPERTFSPEGVKRAPCLIKSSNYTLWKVAHPLWPTNCINDTASPRLRILDVSKDCVGVSEPCMGAELSPLSSPARRFSGSLLQGERWLFTLPQVIA